MYDICQDAEVTEIAKRRFAGEITENWDAFGPVGGYLAGMILNAAMKVSIQEDVHTLTIEFVRPITHGEIDFFVDDVWRGTNTTAVRLRAVKDETVIAWAHAWFGTELPGLEHAEAQSADLRDPAEYPLVQELAEENNVPVSKGLWESIERRCVISPFELNHPYQLRDWIRYKQIPTVDSQNNYLIEHLVLLDAMAWPVSLKPHKDAWRTYRGVTLSMTVHVHSNSCDSRWFLCESDCEVAAGGYLSALVRTSSIGGSPVATSIVKMKCVPWKK